MRLLVALSFFAAVSCGDDSGNASESESTPTTTMTTMTTTPTETGSTTQGTTQGDACLQADCLITRDCPAELVNIDCSGAEICAKYEVEMVSEGSGGDPVDPILTPEQIAAAECILTALRDQTPGKVTAEWEIDMGFGNERIDIEILSNGQAHSLYEEVYDNPQAVSVRVAEIKSADVFDACIGNTDARALFTCIRDWNANICTEGPFSCP